MRKIFDFNHISKDLSEDDIEKFKEIYKHYHRLSECYGKMFRSSRRKDFFLAILKIMMVAGGAGGTLLGCITLNPALLASMSGFGLLIGAYMRKANFSRVIDRHKFAHKNYKKVLNKIREFMRGGHFDQSYFGGELMVIDDLVREACQEISSSADKWYRKEFECSS